MNDQFYSVFLPADGGRRTEFSQRSWCVEQFVHVRGKTIKVALRALGPDGLGSALAYGRHVAAAMNLSGHRTPAHSLNNARGLVDRASAGFCAEVPARPGYVSSQSSAPTSKATDALSNFARVCAWCHPPETQPRAAGLATGPRPVSHGICREHARELLFLLGLEVKAEGEFQVVRRVNVQQKEAA